MATGPQTPGPQTVGKGNKPPTDPRYTRDYLERLENRLAQLEANRLPEPKQLHELTNTGPMSQALAGHSPVYDDGSGLYMPTPVLAVLTFHLVGPLVLKNSPTQWSRFPTYIVGVAASLGTASVGDENAIAFDIVVNGEGVFPVNWSDYGGLMTGRVEIRPPVPIGAYNAGRIHIGMNAIGRGNEGLVVQVELGSAVAGQVGPIPSAGGPPVDPTS
jgi:hypothetical protein